MKNKNKNKGDQPRAEKNRTEDELKKEVAILRENARLIKFKAEGSKSKNVKEAASLRKKIARILTELNKPKQ